MVKVTFGALLYEFYGFVEIGFCGADFTLGILIGVQFETGQVDVGLGHLEREEGVEREPLLAEVLPKVSDRESGLVAAGAGREYV